MARSSIVIDECDEEACWELIPAFLSVWQQQSGEVSVGSQPIKPNFQKPEQGILVWKAYGVCLPLHLLFVYFCHSQTSYFVMNYFIHRPCMCQSDHNETLDR